MAGEKEETQLCPGCQQKRPLVDFCGVPLLYDPEAPNPMLCLSCRTGGSRKLPAKIDPLKNVFIAERRLIAALMNGANSMTAAAKEAGLNVAYARKLIRGEAKPIVREAYQKVLEEHGLTLNKMGKGLAEAVDATKQQWNPAEQEWDEFPDHGVRLKAIQTVAKHLDVDERQQINGQSGDLAISVVINTNLDGPPPQTTEDAFVARAIDVTPEENVSRDNT